MSEWISVSERKPEPNEDCLLLFPGGDCRYDIGFYDDEYDWWAGPNRGFNIFDTEPTHWMPLPEPPA